MGMMEMGMRAVSGRIPKVISPTAHAVFDYAAAGSMFVAAALLWRRHRRAAIASFACGAVEVATAAITDYPGGINPRITFRTHGRLDGALATLVSSMPWAFKFSADEEARWFRAHGVALAAISGLTDFEAESDEHLWDAA